MAAIGNTFESHEPLLQDLLDQVHRGVVQLPDFQRPWVWPDNHIRALLASVSLAYPIGAVMLMQTGGEGVRFRPRLVHGVKLDPPPEPDKLILDGQQRLTSLYGALRSGRPVETVDDKQKPLKRLYYLSIDGCLDPEGDRDEAVVSVPPERVVKKNFGRDVVLDVSTRALEFENGMVPVSILLESTAFQDWRMGFMDHFDMDRDRYAKISEFEREIWMRFQQFKVPVIQLLKDTPKEAVCQVFEKVNTGGVALTVFELMTATFAADDFQLVKDWGERRTRLHQHEVLRSVGGTDFLQAVTLLASYRRHLDDPVKGVNVKRKAVLALTLDEYRDNADLVEEGLKRAARLLARECVFDSRNLPYTTQLVPLGATCAHLGNRFEEEAVRRKLARWYWCGVFGEMYGGANESRYAQDIVDLVRWVNDDGDEPRTVRDASFSPLRLLTLRTRQSAAYKGAMALMVQRGSHDFINGDPIAHTNGFLLPIDIHHIFPRAWARSNDKPKRLYDSIVNKAPLTARTNRILHGDAPSKYLIRAQESGGLSAARLDEILETHYVHPPLLRDDAFEAFVHDRACRLLDAIEEVMGKPADGREADAVIEAFGAPLVWTEEAKKEQRSKVVYYDRYEVLRELTTGGMSTVLQARDLQTGELVCLKRVAARGHDADALLRETSIYDRLCRHEFAHALDVHRIERDDVSIALITEWADGGTLEEYVDSKPNRRLDTTEAHAIATALLKAIEELHALDVVHRDIKPSNVLQHAGGWKLADFGIAKNTLREMTRATMQQVFTPGYAPPEQIEGVRAHASADVYAFGKVLTFMLTGETDPDKVPYPGWSHLVHACSAPSASDRVSVAEASRLLAALPS